MQFFSLFSESEIKLNRKQNVRNRPFIIGNYLEGKAYGYKDRH